MDWSALAQVAGSGAVVGVLSTLFGWLTTRSKVRAEAAKLDSEAGKTTAESRVAESADFRAWIEPFRAEATAARAEASAARADADASRESARQANARADECTRQNASMADEIAELRRDYDRLQERIVECNAGATCPIAEILTNP